MIRSARLRQLRDVHRESHTDDITLPSVSASGRVVWPGPTHLNFSGIKITTSLPFGQFGKSILGLHCRPRRKFSPQTCTRSQNWFALYLFRGVLLLRDSLPPSFRI